MRITLTDKLVARTALEGSTIAFTAKVYDDSSEPWTLSVPTTVRYRLDNPETGCEIIGWTSATAASTVAISIPGTSNTLTTCRDQEPRELTVEVNAGLSTQYRKTRRFHVSSTAVEAA